MLESALVKVFHVFSGDHAGAFAAQNLAFVMDQQGVTAKVAGPEDVVQHHDNGFLLVAGEFAKQFHHRELVRQVEVLQRFVEKQDAGFLGQQLGNAHALAFAAGERGE